MRREHGFVLPSAIFLLVVLGGLAAWLTSVTQATHAQAVLELEGERAYQAAQEGLEAGIYKARQSGSNCAQIAADIPLTGSLARFVVSIGCVAYPVDEAGTVFTLYALTSIACNEPGGGGACPNASPASPEYVERRLRATVAGSP